MIEFQGWPSIPRLYNLDMVISEKIDGTNSALIIEPFIEGSEQHPQSRLVTDEKGNMWEFATQSRRLLITPTSDNAGFARWAWENAEDLLSVLGGGTHFGEWWGSGINKGYGLSKGEKRFSLFNTHRWSGLSHETAVTKVSNLYVVPTLFTGTFDTAKIQETLETLKEHGSYASPGFMKPEGIVIYHQAADVMFKNLCEKDDIHKWQQTK